VAPVFPLRGRLLVLFSIQLPFHKFIRPGDPSGGVPLPRRYPPATRPDTLEDDSGDYDVNGFKDGTSSDRCSSGSGAVWVFCLASGGPLGVIWFPFERRVSSGAPLGSLWPLPGAWAPPAPVWGPRVAFAFSQS
jgi:hypothetical protein